jgi:hypothetical protein
MVRKRDQRESVSSLPLDVVVAKAQEVSFDSVCDLSNAVHDANSYSPDSCFLFSVEMFAVCGFS